MRDLFPGWTPPDEETLSAYWTEATFALDTSVLLDLYRFSEEARSGLLSALRSFGDRLWIPHQVAEEFHRNRFGVLLDQREAEGKLLGELRQIRLDIDEQLSQRLRGAGRRDLAPLRAAIEGGFDQLEEKLSEAEKAHTKGLGESIREDPIYDEVAELCDGRVGPPFAPDHRAEVLADARARLESKTPPGYMDADKEGDARFGDVVLWHQLCEKASETGRPVVLIADDQKEDWVWEVRGKTLGPRPELVAEMRERASVGFHLYTPARLLQVWKERAEGQGVEQEVLDEIAEPLREVDLSFVGGMQKIMKNWEHAKETPSTTAVQLRRLLELERHERERLAPPPLIAEHLFVDGGVELRLRDAGYAYMAIGLSASVTDPDGITWDTGEASSGGGGVPGHPAVFRYPDDFPGASRPQAPGAYAVSWFMVDPRSDSAVRSEFLVARDSFVIPET